MRVTIRILALLVLLAVIACAVLFACIHPDGDANGDGRVNAIDLTMMKRHIVGTYDMGAWQIARCDMNGNGRVDEQDITAVRDRILGGNNGR